MLYLHQILNSVWMMHTDRAVNHLPLVATFLKGNNANTIHLLQASQTDNPFNANNGVCFASLQNEAYHISEYGSYSAPEDAPQNSIAIIEISGTITKHNQFCGPAGMTTKSNILERCYANDKIEGIVLKIESGGGQGMAMRMFCSTIAKRNKAVVAFVEDYACSAAYGIAAACDKIIANDTLATVGSIGTYCTIADFSKQLEMEGINLIDVYATASSDKNSMIREALKGNLEPLQAYVDVFNNEFLKHIEDSRSEKLKTDRKTWGTGKDYFCDEALELGLIDSIDSFDNILNHFN